MAAPGSVPAETSPGTWTPDIERDTRQARFDALLMWPDELPADAFLDVVPTPLQMNELRSGRSTSQPGLEAVGVHVPMRHMVAMGAIEPSDYRGQARQVSTGMAKWHADHRFSWSIAVETPEPDTMAMRLFITGMNLPADVEMYVYGLNNETEIHGPYTKSGPTGTGEFWTNTVFDKMMFVELHSTRPMSATEIKSISFEITDVAVLGGPAMAASAGSDGGHRGGTNEGCLTDANCISEWTYEGTASLGIAHMIYPVGQLTYICTGGLLNDMDTTSFRPYFMTANHCISTQTSASGLECYFRFVTSSCNGTWPALSTLPRTLGSTMLATGAANNSSDYSFLELSQNPPGGSIFLGSTTNLPSAGSSIYRLSHPQGRPQYYSRHNLLATNTYSCGGIAHQNMLHWRLQVGSTQGGSSGSPVMNGAGEVIGQLYGVCGIDIENTCAGDWDGIDGKFSVAYATIDDWINPPNQQPPANDHFENATNLESTLSADVSAVTTYATKQTGEPNHTGNAGGKSVWWRWRAASSGSVEITTFGSNFDTMLALYTGNTVSTLTQVAANDDSTECGSGCRQSKITANVVAGQVYSIAVDGYRQDANTASGTAQLHLRFNGQGSGPAAALDILYLSQFGELWLARNTGQGTVMAPVRVDNNAVGCAQDTNNNKMTMVGNLSTPGRDGKFDIAFINSSGYLFDMVNSNNLGDLFNSWRLNSAGWSVQENGGNFVFPGDFTGDGAIDFVQLTSAGQAWVGASQAGTVTYPRFWKTLGFIHNPSTGLFVGPGDFNGDGKTDLVTVTSYGDAWVSLSTGTTFGTPSRWAWLGFRVDRNNQWGLHLGDFNGDGRTDIAQMTPYTDCWITLSSGTAFSNPTRWGFLGFRDATAQGYSMFAADFNGDGRTDMCQQTNLGELWYALSSGGGFGGSTKAGTLGFFNSTNGPTAIFFGSFD